MKELSIEEKAKRYDEAIEVSRKLMNGEPVNVPDGTLVPVAIFPELAESEDERIRKEIINYLKRRLEMSPSIPAAIGYWIDWLEKQGNTDLEFFENGENEKRKFVGYGFLKCKGDFLSFKEGETYWLEYVGKDNYNVRSDNLLGQTFHITPMELYTVFRPTTWLEKQGEQKDILEDTVLDSNEDGLIAETIRYKKEQKPAEWEPQTGDTFRKKGTISPTYHLCDKREDGITFGFVENREVGMSGGEITISTLMQDYELVERPKSVEDVVEEELNRALQTKIEQKPTEWSKEDEDMLHGIIAFISTMGCDVEGFETWIDWLKSLKDRVQSQHKQEWSEEDEKIRQDTIRVLEEGRDKYIRNSGCFPSWSKSISWLKSLKPQSRWQPSDEQMKALDIAIRCGIQLGSSEEIALRSLLKQLEDLKKLKNK